MDTFFSFSIPYLLITENFLFWTFLEIENTDFFWSRKLLERWHLLITGKFLFWTFWEIVNEIFFEPKSWWKVDIYWLLWSSLFEFFWDEKYGLSLRQKVYGKMIFTDYWKVLVLKVLEMVNTVFSEPKNWWKDGL